MQICLARTVDGAVDREGEEEEQKENYFNFYFNSYIYQLYPRDREEGIKN